MPGATRSRWSYVHKATERVCEVDETRGADRRLIVVPAYTASIDAAMTLIPHQHEWSVNWSGNSLAEVCAFPDGYPIQCGHAATPALALTAAGLRAIAANGDDHE